MARRLSAAGGGWGNLGATSEAGVVARGAEAKQPTRTGCAHLPRGAIICAMKKKKKRKWSSMAQGRRDFIKLMIHA
jgi:hypothetical protein